MPGPLKVMKKGKTFQEITPNHEQVRSLGYSKNPDGVKKHIVVVKSINSYGKSNKKKFPSGSKQELESSIILDEEG